FAEDSIERMAAVFERLVDGVTARPDDPAAVLDVTPADQRRQFELWNATAALYPRELCIHHVFERQVDRTPDATAVSDSRRSLTYVELNREANHVARRLRAAGVGPEVLVALLMPRGAAFLASILGVFKAGAAYVPIDPEYPPLRRSQLLAQSGARVL